jgi:DNA-binding response OmpR family regulator
MENRKVLVIDDEPGLIQLIRDIFGRAGAQVLGACDGPEGIRQFHAHRPDLIILDVMMPGMDGFDVCRHLRQLSDVPILMLTVLGRDEDVTRGLESGADDFVTKPFANQVLLARARALLRRAAMVPGNERSPLYDDGHLTVDLEQRRVLVDQVPIRLTVTEYKLLAYLLQNAGQVLTYKEILEQVWGVAYLGSAQYVHVYIYRLRNKLEKDVANPKYLLTEPGVGYRFERQRS